MTSQNGFTDDELRSITTFYDAVDLLLDKGVIPVVYKGCQCWNHQDWDRCTNEAVTQRQISKSIVANMCAQCAAEIDKAHAQKASS